MELGSHLELRSGRKVAFASMANEEYSNTSAHTYTLPRGDRICTE